MIKPSPAGIFADCCPEPMNAAQAVDLAAAFKALADPVRLRIASIVACCPAGEVCVGEIASEFSVSGPTISHHLKKLREAGVLSCERRASEVYYQVRSDRLDALIGQLTAMRPAAGRTP
ncbi:metalloregulator ArsR/SmtB family transcription factor [Streptomyces sp. NPDC048560]|uniref:ArsR/SmtB family transcription factor n=1 Tax=Streptomyces sp. NPDC048560 TaxID=3155488 RepID=UPI003437D1F1